MASNMFNAPIPGESLTAEPGSMPWEKPPKISEPNEVLEFYMEKLSQEEVMEGIGDMMMIGTPISVITNSLLSSGIMRGVHSVDVKTIIAPMIFENLRTLGDTMGIDYIETSADTVDRTAEQKEKEKLQYAAILERNLGVKQKSTPEVAPTQPLEGSDTPSVPNEPTPVSEQPQASQGVVPNSGGLMSRGVQ